MVPPWFSQYISIYTNVVLWKHDDKIVKYDMLGYMCCAQCNVDANPCKINHNFNANANVNANANNNANANPNANDSSKAND